MKFPTLFTLNSTENNEKTLKLFEFKMWQIKSNQIRLQLSDESIWNVNLSMKIGSRLSIIFWFVDMRCPTVCLRRLCKRLRRIATAPRSTSSTSSRDLSRARGSRSSAWTCSWPRWEIREMFSTKENLRCLISAFRNIQFTFILEVKRIFHKIASQLSSK